VNLEGLARQGTNRLEILYENAGRPNGGSGMWEAKGVSGATLPVANSDDIAIPDWKFKLTPDVRRRPEAPPTPDSTWKEVGIGNRPELDGVQGWAWYEASVDVQDPSAYKVLAFQGVDDNGVVFVNGKRLAYHRGWDEPFEVELKDALVKGANQIAVAVENTDGAGGIYAPVTLTSGIPGRSVTDWEFADRLTGQLQGWDQPNAAVSGWSLVALPQVPGSNSDTVRWYRTGFRLAPGDHRFAAPWKLHIEAGGYALIYLNGRLIGRYADEGPQSDFYLPECWLKPAGQENSLVLAVRDAVHPACLTALQVLPYDGYATAESQRFVIDPSRGYQAFPVSAATLNR